MSERFRMEVSEKHGLVDRGFEVGELKNAEIEAITQSELENNDIGVIVLNGKILLKRYINQHGHIVLTEPHAEPIFVEEKDEFEILGKANRVIYSFS